LLTGVFVHAGFDKKSLSERDICTKFITSTIEQAGWDVLSQIHEEVYFTKGRIIVCGKLVTRGKAKRAYYILYYKPNIPIALIEAKDNNHSVGDDMQQGLEYAATVANASTTILCWNVGRLLLRESLQDGRGA
jgi:type I restriction enzyme R subunit